MRRLFFLVPVFFAACTENNSGNQNPGIVKNDTIRSDTASDWRSLTESWTASLNMKNASIMRSFYADSVLYYGDKISGAVVVERQSNYFSQNNDYRQRITEYISEEQQPDGNWRVRITKRVTAGGKTADYPASLIFAKQNGVWKIVAESDDISDLNKARNIGVHYAPEEVTVEGLMEQTTGFGKVKDGDPKSDAKITYVIIWPSSKLDVSGGDSPTENNIDRLQVEGDMKTIGGLLNKKVTIKGTLSHGDDKHFTKVVLHENSIDEVK
ncbi:MAG: hypothetical protein HY064_13965 [Bacteroidetes bacterium]|nr:hypothetical protein [Bacteroidota bacterium]